MQIFVYYQHLMGTYVVVLMFCNYAIQVFDHLCFLGKLKEKGYSSTDAAAALLLFDNSVEKVCIGQF